MERSIPNKMKRYFFLMARLVCIEVRATVLTMAEMLRHLLRRPSPVDLPTCCGSLVESYDTYTPRKQCSPNVT